MSELSDRLIENFAKTFPDILPVHRLPGLRARLGEMHDPASIMDELVKEADLHQEFEL